MKNPAPLDTVSEMADGCLAGRLRLLNRMVTKIYDDALRTHGLRVTQATILVAIAKAGPLRGVDVANFLKLEKSTLSRDLDRLLDRGWVTATAGTGRAQNLEITESGRALLAKVVSAWRKAQTEARELISPLLADGIISRVNQFFDGQQA